MTSPNDPQLQQDLAAYMPPATRQALQQALNAAYRDAGKHFDIEAGSDPQLFGFMVFKFVAHQIRKVVDADPTLDIEVVGSSTGAFRLRVGPFIVAPYACGRCAPSDPWLEFPGNHNGAGLLVDVNAGQLEIFAGYGDDQTGIVLGHYGNWDTGLEAIFLKKPISKANGQISEWGYVEEIFRIGSNGATAPAPTSPPAPLLPQPAAVVRPKVLPFKRKPQQGTDSGGA